jgi:hypothetical protein
LGGSPSCRLVDEAVVKTAEAYRAELKKALDIHDIASLTRYAIGAGLISLDT